MIIQFDSKLYISERGYREIPWYFISLREKNWKVQSDNQLYLRKINFELFLIHQFRIYFIRVWACVFFSEKMFDFFFSHNLNKCILWWNLWIKIFNRRFFPSGLWPSYKGRQALAEDISAQCETNERTETKYINYENCELCIINKYTSVDNNMY